MKKKYNLTKFGGTKIMDPPETGRQTFERLNR